MVGWRRFLRVPWITRRSNQSMLKEISPEYSLEGLMLKLELQYFATWCEELIHLKRPWCWERLKAGEGDNWGWDGWMASPTRWTWVWASGSWWWTGQGSLACIVHGVTKSWTWLSDWTGLNWKLKFIIHLWIFLPVLEQRGAMVWGQKVSPLALHVVLGRLLCLWGLWKRSNSS